MPADLAVQCEGIVKIYWTGTGEVHALKGIDATWFERGVHAVVGPSGSGKSSLLRILAGMDRPTAGTVHIGHTEVNSLSQFQLHKLRRRDVGYVFQRPIHNLVPYLSAQQHVQRASSLRGGSASAGELLERVGLDERDRNLPHQLSGGEQQRLAFAQAVAGEPALVVADEPTAELDTGSARRLMSLVTDLARSGITFVISTHDPEIVAQADTTLYLRHGAVEAETVQARSLSVIDAAGRVQLPPDALKMFPNRRAVLVIENGEVRITPP